MDLTAWLGLALMILAGIAFLVQVERVLEGLKPPRTLINEALHDLGLFCLGLAGVLDAPPLVRGLLVGVAFLALVSYLVRRYGRHAPSQPDG